MFTFFFIISKFYRSKRLDLHQNPSTCTYTTILKMADNNNQQPGLIGSHVQYVKGAAEVSPSQSPQGLSLMPSRLPLAPLLALNHGRPLVNRTRQQVLPT